MRILVSNDDGVYSPGIRVLAEVASEYGEVRVVAPDVERSSAGHAITHSHPMTYRRTTIQGLTAYRVNGTPADCVALGAYHWGKVDLVLSGLNIGLNLGNSIWHSGTVAAARQAVLLGLRGIALSAPAGAEPVSSIQAVGSPCSRGGARRVQPVPCERESSPRAAWACLDAHVCPPLRRTRCADERSAGP